MNGRTGPGGVVEVMATKETPTPPAGHWKIIDRAPLPGTWWLLPVDERARRWAQENPRAITQGCMEMHSRVLLPAGHKARS